MRKSIFQILLLFTILLECLTKRYVDMVYSEMLTKMTELSQKYPRFCKLFDVRKEYTHLIDTYCGRGLCEHWYLQITDFNLPAEKINTLPQVLFLGGIHGDEVLGPNIIMNLAEHLLQKNEESEEITRLIKSRVMILLPIANPSGFDLKRREERQGSNTYLDPNRDFPYNIRDGKCFQTACARVINFLFKKYLIQAAITFHGGQQVISYPWGAFNHIKSSSEGHQTAEESPDNQAFADVANILSAEGGSNLYLSLKPYPTGKMTDTVYAVDGGMEDWAYAASWETKFSPDVISRCERSSDTVPITPEDTQYNPQSVRSMIYLIETANSKSPATTFLGTSDGLEPSQDKYAYGHIPINIKICLALADILEPYVKLKEMEYIEERNILTIQWQGGGCKHVDSTSIEWIFNNEDSPSLSHSDVKQGPGYYENKEQVYEHIIDLSNQNFSVSLLIKLTCDQAWGTQVDPKPVIGPQTHMVQSRVNQSYYAESNGYKVIGKKVVELKMEDITKDTLLKKRIKDIKELSLAIDFSECSTFTHVGTTNMQLNNSINITALGIRGTLDVEDPFLEGHLHQYADTSRCLDSVGSVINYEDLKATTEFADSRLFTMQKDQIKTVKIDYNLALEKEEDVVNLIGRSVILEKKGHSDKIFAGQIVPVQPSSCKKSAEMRNCIGTDLGSRSGVCVLNMMLEETMRNFKLFIDPNPDKRSVTIQGFIPVSIIDRFNKFQEIYIMNEKTERKFFIKKKIGGYGIIESSTFNLYPQIALGNQLRVYIQASDTRLLLGDCSIGLKDSQFNETAYIIDKLTILQQEKAFALRNQLLLFLLICVLLVIIGLVVFFVLKRYKSLKQQNFEVAMTERKERYADTARMISTARGLASARGIPQSGASTVRESARSGFSLFGTRGYGTQRGRRDHMELQENSMEETSR